MDLNYALTISIFGIVAIVAIAHGKGKIAEKALDSISGLTTRTFATIFAHMKKGSDSGKI